MSMMEPDDAEWMPADDPAAESSWMPAGQYDERVWGMPPRPPPGMRPPAGQFPGRPVWPFWGYWGYRLRNAQRDIKYLAEVVNDILDARLSQIAQSGIPGVTDGTDAAKGSVGEFVTFMQTQAVAAGAQSYVINVGTLSPGDWDVWAYTTADSSLGAIGVTQTPLPSGFNDQLGNGVNGKDAFDFLGNIVRANVTVPTLIVLTITTSAAAAAAMKVQVSARRMR